MHTYFHTVFGFCLWDVLVLVVLVAIVAVLVVHIVKQRKRETDFEDELAEKSARLAELDALLSMDGGPEDREDGDRDEGDLEEDEARPSVLADLKDKASRIAPENRTGRNPREEVL